MRKPNFILNLANPSRHPSSWVVATADDPLTAHDPSDRSASSNGGAKHPHPALRHRRLHPLPRLRPLRSPPSAASWWRTTEKYKGGSSNLVVGRQALHEAYTLGKSLNNRHLRALAGKFNALAGTITVVLTAADVAVDGFCMRCGTHGSSRPGSAFVWVGNSETQCPGQCAWPFHQPMYGPQTPPLVAPSGDVGADGMVINLATLLAGAVTNPFGGGYFQGPADAPLEAVSACTGIYGSGAYPGYPGRLLVDKVTGASYNAHGLGGRKFLLPAMWDPETSACKTLV
ncbi:hypothetical protein NL676_039296 [Syzygium grande]|nr:hypothetical protein NL676_039296 [Syzygium grande]